MSNPKSQELLFMHKNYNMKQVILPLDLEIIIPEDDICFAIHELIESIPEEKFTAFKHETGRPSFQPRMMLKLILCAYTQSTFSGRKIENSLRDSIRMMWLAQGEVPSYRTINRYRVHPLMAPIIQDCFVQFRNLLVQEKMIDETAIFIDGTKLEANANKFTFVWKKSIERFSTALIEKSKALYQELLTQEIIPAIEVDNEAELSTQELTVIENELAQAVETLTQEIDNEPNGQKRKALRSQRKPIKLARKQVANFILRKETYKQHFTIMGARNSYSKTDLDATFMRMKDDYMGNGQLKAAYNLQIATENQYVLAYEVYPNPTDTRTLPDFLAHYQDKYRQLPNYIIADAGYGGEENYQTVLNTYHRTPLITYNAYEKEQKRKFKQDPFKTANWPYVPEEDYFICPNHQKVTYRYESCRTDKYGLTRDLKIYECEDCQGCPVRKSCTRAKSDNNRRLQINPKWESFKSNIKQLLSEKETGKLYSKRKVDVEPAFARLKANLGFCRFSVRGKDKVRQEIGLALMAINLRKLMVNCRI